jgi:uncharacterized protein with GYD domain
MSAFLMLGNYTSHATQAISKARTKQVASLISECGGEMKDIYGLLGAYDLAIVAEFPDNESAIRTSLSLTKMTGITFSTLPAVKVEAFDNLVSDI